MVFQILPTIVDIIIAIVYFVTAFNYIFGLVVFLAMAMYLGKTCLLIISVYVHPSIHLSVCLSVHNILVSVQGDN